MTKNVHYEGNIEITIPDDKIQDILKSYQDCINESGIVDDLFASVAHQIVYCGATTFVEGIGDSEIDFIVEEFNKPELDILD
jgi:hypothetical protein